MRDRVSHVFGIANFSYAGRAPHDFDALASAILADLGDAQAESFRVSARARRQAVSVHVAADRARGRRAASRQATGWRVDLDDPALTIHVELLTDDAFYFFGKEPGAGGLPTGTGGRVACLLSGGIDSPVAAYRMMRRGCSVLLDSLSQLSDSVARVAGKGPRDRGAADEVPAAVAAAAGAVRRAAAAGAAGGARRTARRDLSAADAADCRTPGAASGARGRS